ncbi:MAG: type II toxin-antitoxin system VapC family toxin [Syntrophobacteraceae bacterium]
MRTDGEEIVVYWDTSAVLSSLFSDNHSGRALDWANRNGFHFLSSLTYAETCAVIARMRRERKVAKLLADAAMEVFNGGPWRRVNALPAWNQMATLSKKWDLRGADLWHLALAKSLRDQIPELIFLTFDRKLWASAKGEGFVMEMEDLS